MPEHVLEDGIRLIKGLRALGEALGYHVIPEMPVKQEQSNPPAVDVAWLSEAGQIYPLMIFEVESRVTNAVTSNAAKVFGQTNQEFEKPLFFFHAFIKGGQNTSRLEPLLRLFGTYNYRYYLLARGESTALVKDVLSQHRRLSQSLNLLAIVPVLKGLEWQGIDLSAVVSTIEELGFERNNNALLTGYAKLSRTHPEFQDYFLRYLQAQNATHGQPIPTNYPSYFGKLWSELIHIGLLAAAEPKVEYIHRLQQWQEGTKGSGGLSAIGPHFGLSQDYDDFIFHLAGPLWSLIAALMRDLPEAGQYIAGQCYSILSGMEDGHALPKYSIPFALWMLHIAASSPLASKEFEFARNHINGRGGISSQVLYRPVIYSSEEPYKPYRPQRIPGLEEFIKGYGGIIIDSTERRFEAISLGVDTLLFDQELMDVWPMQLVRVLSGRSSPAATGASRT